MGTIQRALMISTYQRKPVTTTTLMIIEVGARLETTIPKVQEAHHVPMTIAALKTTMNAVGEATMKMIAIDGTKIVEETETNPNLNPTVRRAIQAMIQPDVKANTAAKLPENPKDAVVVVIAKARAQRTINAVIENQRLALIAQSREVIRRGVHTGLQSQPIGVGFPVAIRSIPSTL